MIKNVILVAACILFLSTHGFGQRYSEGNVTYNGIGAGGQVSFVATDYYGPAFGFGFHGVLELVLGKFGTVQYNPSIGIYFNSDRVINDSPTERTEDIYHNRQVSLNIFDARYFFPVPSSIFIRPYGGFGLCIVINSVRHEEITTNKLTTVKTHSDVDNRDSDGGFNMFAGIDFPVNKVFVPYIETRFTASDNWAFRLTGGMTFRF